MNNKLSKLTSALAVSASAFFASQANAGEILDAVRDAGVLRCGVNQSGNAGFSATDSTGRWEGLDVDFCRAVAAAVLSDPEAVEFVPLSGQQRFAALQAGEIDVLSRTTTWTLTRDASLGVLFAGVNFYDGQGFLVRADLGVSEATDLDGAEVCVMTGTTSELNVSDFFRSNDMTFTPIVFESLEEVRSSFFNGRCQVYTADRSSLASVVAVDAENPDDYVILPGAISKEPLGPVVRRGDDDWFTIVRWTLMALIQAEESGVSQANLDEMLSSTNPTVARLLGTSGEMGSLLGLDNEWARRAIAAVGNYGDMYERNIVPIGLERNGMNRLWTDGGLMYPMPIR